MGDRVNPAWKNPSPIRGMKDEKSQPDQDGRERLVCTVCIVLPPLGHFRFVVTDYPFTFYFYNINVIVIISKRLF